jgi:sialate O-acetylesterase
MHILPNQSDPSENRKNPSVIYNAMIAPFADLGLKGFLWYQGEANASDAAKYKKCYRC